MSQWIFAPIAWNGHNTDLLQFLTEIGFFVDTQVQDLEWYWNTYKEHPLLLVLDPIYRNEAQAYIQAWPSAKILFQDNLLQGSSISDVFALLGDQLPIADLNSKVSIGNWIEFEMASSRQLFESSRVLMRSLLAHSLSDKDSMYHILHSICEVLMNAMEHGNQFDASKQVRCSWVLFQDRLIVKIVDQGSGFLVSQLENTLEQPFQEAENRKRLGKRQGGYGLALARKWMDLQFSEQGNTVVLTKVF